MSANCAVFVMLLTLNFFSHKRISPHYMSYSLSILETSTYVTAVLLSMNTWIGSCSSSHHPYVIPSPPQIASSVLLPYMLSKLHYILFLQLISYRFRHVTAVFYQASHVKDHTTSCISALINIIIPKLIIRKLK